MAQNMREAGEFFEPGEVNVVEWHPQEEGAGHPTQVHVVLTFGPAMHALIRLKSRAAAVSLIAALQEHADAVWPAA